VSDVACRRAPVAIGELILPELCGGAPNQRLLRKVGENGSLGLVQLLTGCAPENRQLIGPLEAGVPAGGPLLR